MRQRGRDTCGQRKGGDQECAQPAEAKKQAPGSLRAAERAGRHEVREADANKGAGHQPAMGDVVPGELTDRASDGVKRRRLNSGGDCPAADEQQRRG